jgi:hypothetical protein
MKNKFFIYVISVFILSCHRQERSCWDSNAKLPKNIFSENEIFELGKDRILVYPIIDPDSTLYDVYGYKIKYYFPQWYMVSRRVKVLAPVNIHVWNGVDGYTDYPTPDQLVNAWSQLGVSVDTVDLSSIVPSLSKTALLITGEYEATMASENFAEIKRTH